MSSGGRERGREGGREEGREGEREGKREGGREEGREGGRNGVKVEGGTQHFLINIPSLCPCVNHRCDLMSSFKVTACTELLKSECESSLLAEYELAS